MLLMELTLGHLEKELQSNIGQFCKELSRGARRQRPIELLRARHWMILLFEGPCCSHHFRLEVSLLLPKFDRIRSKPRSLRWTDPSAASEVRRPADSMVVVDLLRSHPRTAPKAAPMDLKG